MKNLKIQKALRAIAQKHHGHLLPEVVVDEARSPKSPLHSRFTWDDTEAAHQHRLWQARQLISVCVEVLADDTDPSPVFVSLSSDRMHGKGYRVMCDVMNDADMREQLLKDALAELNKFQIKYRTLRKLAEVFSAIRKVNRKIA